MDSDTRSFRATSGLEADGAMEVILQRAAVTEFGITALQGNGSEKDETA